MPAVSSIGSSEAPEHRHPAAAHHRAFHARPTEPASQAENAAAITEITHTLTPQATASGAVASAPEAAIHGHPCPVCHRTHARRWRENIAFQRPAARAFASSFDAEHCGGNSAGRSAFVPTSPAEFGTGFGCPPTGESRSDTGNPVVDCTRHTCRLREDCNSGGRRRCPRRSAGETKTGVVVTVAGRVVVAVR